MAVTGTSTFTVTRDDVIKAALRNLGALGSGETPSTEDYTNCSQALNIMIKSWAKKGLPLWVTQEITIPMVSGTGSYQLGPTATGTGAVVMARPLKFLDGTFIRDTDGNDTTLLQIARKDYDTLGTKSAAGRPNQFYYDTQLTNGVLYLMNVPNNSTDVIHGQIQRQFFDMTSSGDSFDFPQEWFQALKWGLSDELSAEYAVDAQMIPYYNAKARQFEEECFGFSVEEASVMFTVDNRGGAR
jgi:hypothetical protein